MSGIGFSFPELGLPSERGGTQRVWLSAAASLPDRRLFDDEGGVESYGPRQVVEVWRGRHHRLVDLGEFLRRAAAADADDVVQRLVAPSYSRVDSEEPAQIDLALGFDLQ